MKGIIAIIEELVEKDRSPYYEGIVTLEKSARGNKLSRLSPLFPTHYNVGFNTAYLTGKVGGCREYDLGARKTIGDAYIRETPFGYEVEIEHDRGKMSFVLPDSLQLEKYQHHHDNHDGDAYHA
ncbi:hypothetical protein H6504_05390 [Candidatus Woesearchaeota archaeon]|nr:hypothetical protein [Candidatus Woesearchaeota archaeon]